MHLVKNKRTVTPKMTTNMKSTSSQVPG